MATFSKQNMGDGVKRFLGYVEDWPTLETVKSCWMVSMKNRPSVVGGGIANTVANWQFPMTMVIAANRSGA